MPVPHRQLYRCTFTRELAVPASRSGVVGGYRLVEKNVPYVMTEKMVERMRESDPGCTAEPIPDRPFSEDTKRLLVFFPGGIGDVISLEPCLYEFSVSYPEVEIGVASTMADQCIIGHLCTLWDYPLTEVVANYYDAWINIAELDRASVGQELSVTFSEYLGMPATQCYPNVEANEYISAAMSGYIRDPSRLKVGIQWSSACHFRSIPQYQAMVTAIGFSENGCDSYIIGSTKDRIGLRDEKMLPTAPPEHVYDMTIYLEPVEHFIAFISLMDAIVTPDTSTLHVAGALDIPCVGIFGMTHGNERTKAYPSVTYIQGEAECAPCWNITKDPPCDNKWCNAIMNVSPELIVERTLDWYGQRNLSHSH